MKINTTYLILKTDESIKASTSKLRGYIGNTFKENYLLHNHYGDERFLYSYPLVQYHIMKDQAMILGIEEGVNSIKNIVDEINYLHLDKKYEVIDKQIYDKQYDVQPTSEEYHYKFITPWMALNPSNYKDYKTIDNWKDRKLFLNNILVGNILSMSKGLNIIVNKKLYVKSHLEEERVKYKNIEMTAFKGEFKVHYKIPDFFGFGKGVSQGFGSVKMIDDSFESIIND